MLISVKKVTHVYNKEPVVKALDNLNLAVNHQEFVGLIGPTGSGKSTLVQLFNGLIKPTSGEVWIDGLRINKEKINLKIIRQKIGLVFQYPEHQIFEETVFKEIAFGPKNLALDKQLIEKRVARALSLVSMDYQEFKDRSPFNLSGGQQRKIAIAGVLAMEPSVLILDEPFAGLDPEGRKQLTNLLFGLHREQKITLILISHRMDEIARLATRVVVLNKGRVVMDDIPVRVFNQYSRLQELGLGVPRITEILLRLKENGFNVSTDIFDLKKAVTEIHEKFIQKKRSYHS